MRPLGIKRTGPVTVCDELRELFARVPWEHRDDTGQTLPALHLVLGELGGWLTDSRSYKEEPRRDEWGSLSDDLQAAAAMRGSRVRALTPTVEKLIRTIDRNSGPASGKRLAATRTLTQARIEMAAPSVLDAAYDDLIRAISKRESRSEKIEGLFGVLETCMREQGRSLAMQARTMAGIFDNWSWEIGYARELLDGTAPDPEDRKGSDVGLSVTERLELGRRLLARAVDPTLAVVWLAFDNARCDPRPSTIAGATFFNGPDLVEILRQAENDPDAYPQGVVGNMYLVPEFTGAGSRPRWPATDHWVAARVDMGRDAGPDLVERAWSRVRAVWELATINSGGSTSWTPMGGYWVYRDRREAESSSFRERVSAARWVMADRTEDWVEEIAPAFDGLLAEPDEIAGLTRDAHTLRTLEVVDAGTALVASVRVLERAASLRHRDWRDHVIRGLMDRDIVGAVTSEIYNAVAQYVGDPLRDRTERMEQISQGLMRSDPDRRHGVIYDIGGALAAAAELEPSAERYGVRERRLRTLVSRTKTTGALANWYEDLEKAHRARLARVARIRNCAAHGGPVHEATAESIRLFAAAQATTSTQVALNAILDGTKISRAFDDLADESQKRRQFASRATSVDQALFHDPSTGA
jgi:hypothetical protein